MRLVQAELRLPGVVDVAHERIEALRRQRQPPAASVGHRSRYDAPGGGVVAHTRHVDGVYSVALQGQDVISVR